MRADGIEANFQGAGDDYIFMHTTDPAIAEKHGFQEDEEWDEGEEEENDEGEEDEEEENDENGVDEGENEEDDMEIEEAND